MSRQRTPKEANCSACGGIRLAVRGTGPHRVCVNKKCIAYGLIPRTDTRTRADILALYNELIMAVESKHPNESRHQTALRYITQTERGSSVGIAGRHAGDAAKGGGG